MAPVMPGLIGFAASAVTAFVVLLVSGWLRRPRSGVPLALGLGYAFGHAASREWILKPFWPPFVELDPTDLQRGRAYALGHAALREWIQHATWPPFPPLDAPDWLPWIVLVAVALGVLDASWPCPPWARWENRAAVTAGLLWLLLGPVYFADGGTKGGLPVLLGLGALILAGWGYLDWSAERLGRGMVLPLAALMAGTGVVLLFSGYLILAEASFVLIAALLAAWVIGQWRRDLTLARGGIPVVTVVFAGLLLGGYHYAEMPKASGLLLAAAPWALLVEKIGPIARLSPRLKVLVRLVAIAIPIGAAVAIAVHNAPKEAAAL